MTLSLILLIAAAVFAILQLCAVPSRVNWNSLAILCIVGALVIGHYA